MMDCPYRDGFGYQENIIPRKHKELGLDVQIVTYNQQGDASYDNTILEAHTFNNSDGIPVHVLAKNPSILKKIPFIVGWINTTIGLENKLEELKPDYIFVHGLCRHDNMDVIRYVKRHPAVRLYADNHSDYYNTPINTFREKSFRYVFGRYSGKQFGKYARKVWGVTPWRVTYQQEVYGVPAHKSDLLIMGGDESLIHWEEKDTIRKNKLSKLNIPFNSFVIITGGKIDRAKNIHILIEALRKMKREDVYLIVFGKAEKDMVDFMNNVNDDNIRNIGWIGSDDCYDLYLASDLAVFPGTHSVLWEQACASGLPCVVKDWDKGFNHVDVGGNCIITKDITVDGLSRLLSNIIDDKETYNIMKTVASTKARTEFSYIEIAKRAIELDN